MIRVVCLSPLEGDDWSSLKTCFEGADVIRATTLDELADLAGPDAVLFGFGSGLIVTKDLLARFRVALNIHAATPEFPGRDPHHHAVYSGTQTYGATLHHMVAAVDAGPIVDVERFDVVPGSSPADLLTAASAAGMRLAQRYGPIIAARQPLPKSHEAWSGHKSTRDDLRHLSRIDRFIGPEELARRYHAFDGGAHDNLTTRLFDLTFRVDKSGAEPASSAEDWIDFTENGYRQILTSLVEAGYQFASLHQRPQGRHVIWRHDVDLSLQRALWCAKAEQEVGAMATYFINPRCDFYNLLEPTNLDCIKAIADLGHEIGLHFDAGAMLCKVWTAETLEAALGRECALLEAMTGISVRTVSWHNPDQSNLLEFDEDEIAGLINAYGKTLKANYTYCSDSNGYWRFTPMPEVIAEGHETLYLLTHPGWWTPHCMPPRARIERAIAGRASNIMAQYDEALTSSGRKNIR